MSMKREIPEFVKARIDKSRREFFQVACSLLASGNYTSEYDNGIGYIKHDRHCITDNDGKKKRWVSYHVIEDAANLIEEMEKDFEFTAEAIMDAHNASDEI